MIGPGDHCDAPSHSSWTTLPPGTVLDAVLETFSPPSLESPDLFNAIAACERQISHLYALQAQIIMEVLSRQQNADALDADFCLRSKLDDHLVPGRVCLAVELMENLPATWSALDAGQITLEKAGIIVECTRHLPQGTRIAVERPALERAPKLTDYQLRRWLVGALGPVAENCRVTPSSPQGAFPSSPTTRHEGPGR